MSSLPADITLVWVDHVGSDWVGIYKDSDKVYEGHPPDFDEALDRLGITHEDRTIPSEKLSNLRRMRGLPARLPREVVSKEPGE